MSACFRDRWVHAKEGLWMWPHVDAWQEVVGLLFGLATNQRRVFGSWMDVIWNARTVVEDLR